MGQYLIWIWLGVALIFFIAEIFTTGFFLMGFGIGAVAAGIVAILGFDPIWQFAAFIVFSALALAFLRPFANRVTSHTKNSVGIDRVVGRPAVVLEEIDPIKATGMVRVDREEWRAESVDGGTIAKGTVVEVVNVQGTRLFVKLGERQVLDDEMLPNESAKRS